MKNKKRISKQKRNNWFFLTALIVFLIVYLGISFIFTYNNSLTTTIAKKGSLENVVSTVGYVFKDSTIITSKEAGYIDCLFKDDEKVKKGDAVVAVYKDEVDVNLKNEIAEITERINAINDTLKYITSTADDENKAEQKIAEEMRKISKLSDKKDIEQIAQIKKNINSVLLRRTNADEKVEKDELNKLKEKLAELTAKKNSKAYTVYANASGTFISHVDGTEEFMSLTNLEKNGIDEKKLKEISKIKPDSKVVTKISENEPVGKIIDNFAWVIAAEVSRAKGELFNIGEEVYLRFPDSEENLIKGTITQILNKEKDVWTVCVKSNKYSKTVYRLHKTNVELIKQIYSGIMIPQEALRIVDGKKGVYVLKGAIAKFIPIDIVHSDEKWVIVREKDSEGSLMLYDEVIIKGRNLYNEKVVR